MKAYDIKCPICGTVNKQLYLEETNGWMECEHCKHTIQTQKRSRPLSCRAARMNDGTG